MMKNFCHLKFIRAVEHAPASLLFEHPEIDTDGLGAALQRLLATQLAAPL
jgi:hypothetical protein